MAKVTVYATAKNPYHKTGMAIELEEVQAANFIRKGLAVAEKETEPKVETKSKTTKTKKNEKDN
jgi:hypothetical protein